MTEWLISIEGTSEGRQLAMFLALIAAFMHAIFGALQKGRHDPWLTRGAIDFCYGIIAMPFALFVVPWPEPHMWLIFAGMFVIHMVYKYTQAKAYSYGAYTVVYPVVRGLGPVVTVLAAGIVFGEQFAGLQWGGLLLLTLAILALAVLNLSREKVDRHAIKLALAWAVATGFMVAAYTTYDAYGIRETPNPFTFLAWFFFIDGFLFPIIAVSKWRRMEHPPLVRPLMVRGFIGSLVAFMSFGSILLATRLDKVGEAAVLRETSTVFAAIIGWLFLKETVGPARAVLMSLIAAGAVLVEFGG
ncbi:MAG: EamA family transporter [Proteobacteria bacterium]|nr:EamA family transporter [Pseudomonadota bacterium]